MPSLSLEQPAAAAAKPSKGSKRPPAAESSSPKAAKKAKTAKTASTGAAAAEQGCSPKPKTATLTDDQYRATHEITLKNAGGDGKVALVQSFEQAPFPAALQKALLAQGFTAPTPIQAQAWPLAMTGRDVLAIAKTGSGKTCGYLLPTIARALEARAKAPAAKQGAGGAGGRRMGTPCILVMAPTRELAVQIQEQAVVFGRAVGFKSCAVYGGAPKGPQIRDIQSGASIVIATPGRLLDMLAFTCQDGSSVMSLSEATQLVLDEADRMCDMGFEEPIKQVVEQMPASRQTLFFTATWPKSVQRVAGSILRNPIHVHIGNTDQLSANKDVTQVIEVVPQRDKYERLVALLKAEVPKGSRTIVFCNKKYLCNEVESGLWEAGHSVGAIHGDKTQQEREWALAQLRAGKMDVLVATDVAARGLDIKGMDRVINYDFPNNTEDYVHRIGRTGRAGASGVANTFFTDADGKHAKELTKILRESKQAVPPALDVMAMRSGGGGGGGKWGGGGNKWGGGGGNKWGGGGNKWGGKRY